MRYCIVGAGGTGGALIAYLSRAGIDATVIARGDNLHALQEKGLTLIHENGQEEIIPVKAAPFDGIVGGPDLCIIVCVKEYSLTEIMPQLKELSQSAALVIPILNVYGTGERLQKELSCLCMDGCIYVAAQKKAPGVIQMNGDILRLVYGPREKEDYCRALFEVREDMQKADIEVLLSDNIKRDALQKFSFVSPMAAAELYFEKNAGAFQVTGDKRDFFVSLVKEIDALAAAMDVPFLVDVVRNNLAILDNLNPNATTSLHRDILAGGKSEIDGLIYEVSRLAGRYKVDTPCYDRVCEKMHLQLNDIVD